MAHHHRKILQGLRFKATSPNGRFVEGAKAIDGKPLEKVGRAWQDGTAEM